MMEENRPFSGGINRGSFEISLPLNLIHFLKGLQIDRLRRNFLLSAISILSVNSFQNIHEFDRSSRWKNFARVDSFKKQKNIRGKS